MLIVWTMELMPGVVASWLIGVRQHLLDLYDVTGEAVFLPKTSDPGSFDAPEVSVLAGAFPADSF